MEKMLISLPNNLSHRFKALVPSKQRSKIISKLIEEEVKRREQQLFECAQAVENDKELNHEMREWDITLKDGLSDE